MAPHQLHFKETCVTADIGHYETSTTGELDKGMTIADRRRYVEHEDPELQALCCCLLDVPVGTLEKLGDVYSALPHVFEMEKLF